MVVGTPTCWRWHLRVTRRQLQARRRHFEAELEFRLIAILSAGAQWKLEQFFLTCFFTC